MTGNTTCRKNVFNNTNKHTRSKYCYFMLFNKFMYLHLSKFLITGFVYIWNEDALSTAACKPLIWLSTYALSKIYIGSICFLRTKHLTVMFVIYSRIDLLNDKDDTFLSKNIVFCEYWWYLRKIKNSLILKEII